MCGGEAQLVSVAEVEVVDAEDEGLQVLALLEDFGEGAYEGGFADALDTVEADNEGAGGVCGAG